MKKHLYFRRGSRSFLSNACIVLLLIGAVIGSLLVVRRAHSRVPLCDPSSQLIAFIGDSYTNGAGTDGGYEKRFPALVASHLHGGQPQILGFNGSGYVTRGPKPYSVTFPEAAQRVKSSARVVVVFGSRNDTASREEVEAAALRTYRTIQQRAPHAKIIVFGPPWINDLPDDRIKRDRDAVQAAAKVAGVEFHDPLADGWFAEKAQIQQGKSKMIAGDHIHPNDAGHAYIAAKMERTLPDSLCEVSGGE